MNSSRCRPGCRSHRGFTLLEALASIAILGILSWVAVAAVSNHTRGAAKAKLDSDVAAINQAIRVYLANGGSLAGITDPQAVLDKMKTARSAEDDAKHAGFSGAMIDPRLAARPTTDAEAASSRQRANWNPSRLRFEIAATGAGVAEFVLDEAKGRVNYGTETRLASAFEYETGNGWIWPYRDADPGAPRSEPTLVALSDPSQTSVPANPASNPWPAPSRFQLQPPVFSHPGGSYRPSTFDLSLSIADPNSSCSSWIMVALDGGEWTRYAAPLTIGPETRVTAFVTGDPYLYYSSGAADALFSASPPEVLAAPRISPSADQFLWSTVETVLVTLENPNEAGTSGLEYQVNGGGWLPFGAPFELSIFDYPAGASIVARAMPRTIDYAASPESGAVVMAPPPPVALQRPDVSPSAPEFIGGSRETISVAIQNPNPTGSVLDYRFDGGAWQVYSGAFDVSLASHPGGVTVEARARATSPAYTDSEIASAPIGFTPGLLAVPTIALSSDKFDATTSVITVTLTDPNSGGRAELRYALKQPAAGYPPVSEFLAYTGPFAVAANSYPDGFHVQAYAKALDPVLFQDSDPAEAVTAADFFGVPLDGDILFVLDASGSMNANFANTSRFKRVMDEAIQAINTLGSSQKFSVITFNDALHWSDGSNDLKPATPENKQAAIDALLSLDAYSGTNYEVGLAYAVGLVTKPAQVMFLSDGLPNRKNYDDELNTVVSLGIKVNTIGIGNRDSQRPLEEIAQRSGGTYVFVVEPGSSGTLAAPRFSIDGNFYDYSLYPLALSLSNPNTLAGTRIRFSVNGSALATYTGPLNLGYNSTVEAFVESPDPAWAPSVKVSETYSVRSYSAVRPTVSVSAGVLTDSAPAVTVTLNDLNPAGLTSLVWWFGTKAESSAVAYTGPFTVSAAEWNSLVGESVTQVAVVARAAAAQSFVVRSVTSSATIENKTTAFLNNLRKPALKLPVFSPEGNSFDFGQFPLSVSISNPNGSLGQIQVSVNGSAYAPYTGPLSVAFNSVVTAYVKATNSSYRSSAEVTESFTAKAFTLAKPTISLSATAFTPTVQSIAVTLNNPNLEAISRLVYWFEGQSEAAAVPYTGPFTLSAGDWESMVARRRAYVKLYVRAVGNYGFARASSAAYATISNTN